MIAIRESLPRRLDERDAARLVDEIQETFARKVACAEHGHSVRKIEVEGNSVACTPCCDDVAPLVKLTLGILVRIHFERS
jgi:hypothetical protein